MPRGVNGVECDITESYGVGFFNLSVRWGGILYR